MKNSLRHNFCYVLACFVLLVGRGAIAQGVCDNLPAGHERGDFEIIGGVTSGCSPMTVQVRDLSGGTDIRYDFNYNGYNLRGGTATSDVLRSISDQTTTYTILQYGKKNGKDMWACKNVTVRPNIEFSYSQCNFEVGVQITKQAEIPGFTIKYKLGNYPEVSVPYASLPLDAPPQAIIPPATLEVFAVDAAGTKICSKTETVTLPTLNPYRVQVEKLEMLSPTKVEVTLKGSHTAPGYEVFMYTGTTALRNTPLPGRHQPGSFIVDLPDSTNSYCFYAEKPQHCGGWDTGPDLCTIPLRPIVTTINDNTLYWKNHTNLIYGLPPFPLLRMRQVNTQLIREVVGESETNIPIVNTEIFTDPINCQKEYCYQIEATVRDLYSASTYDAKSLSLKRCIKREDIKVPPITDLYTSVDNEIQINYTDNSNWPLTKLEYLLYHEVGGEYIEVAKSPTVTPFGYGSADPNLQSQCFKVAYKDECGSTSFLSPEVCTIFLSLDDPDIQWTLESPFSPSAPQSYIVEGRDEAVPTFTDLANLPNSTSTYQPDYSAINEEAVFRIRSVDHAGNVSYSNILRVPLEFSLFLPQIFTPNGDGHNDLLKAAGRKSMVKDFKMEVFDRWGAKVTTFEDINFEWDGVVNGQKLKNGVYTLKSQGVLNTGETFSRKDTLFIKY